MGLFNALIDVVTLPVKVTKAVLEEVVDVAENVIDELQD